MNVREGDQEQDLECQIFCFPCFNVVPSCEETSFLTTFYCLNFNSMNNTITCYILIMGLSGSRDRLITQTNKKNNVKYLNHDLVMIIQYYATYQSLQLFCLNQERYTTTLINIYHNLQFLKKIVKGNIQFPVFLSQVK